jgi:hypothetical protein
MNNWKNPEIELPEEFIDILAYCENKGGLTYKIGEKYMCIDRLVIWKDGSKPSFRTKHFGYGEVLAWQHLPKAPKEKELRKDLDDKRI